MKKRLLMTFLSYGTLALAQHTGKVGINTENPTETLQVSGTMRIETLPQNNATNAIYTKTDGTSSNSKDQVFTATKTLVVDANGVLGVIDGLPKTDAVEENTIVKKSYGKCVQITGKTSPSPDYTLPGSILSFDDYEIRFHWFNNTPWTTGGNYFEIRNTKQPIKFNSWGTTSRFNDNGEQDMVQIQTNVWTRFTENYAIDIAGVKYHNEEMIIQKADGSYDRISFKAPLLRFTKPSTYEGFCVDVDLTENIKFEL